MSTAATVDLTDRLENLLREPRFFHEVLEALEGSSYRAVLRAWSELRLRHDLVRDEHGRYGLPAA